jgi:hypothetical protein
VTAGPGWQAVQKVSERARAGAYRPSRIFDESSAL